MALARQVEIKLGRSQWVKIASHRLTRRDMTDVEAAKNCSAAWESFKKQAEFIALLGLSMKCNGCIVKFGPLVKHNETLVFWDKRSRCSSMSGAPPL